MHPWPDESAEGPEQPGPEQSGRPEQPGPEQPERRDRPDQHGQPGPPGQLGAPNRAAPRRLSGSCLIALIVSSVGAVVIAILAFKILSIMLSTISAH